MLKHRAAATTTATSHREGGGATMMMMMVLTMVIWSLLTVAVTCELLILVLIFRLLSLGLISMS
jgi:hypothetical protein